MGSSASINGSEKLEQPLSSFSGFCPFAPVPKGRPRFVRRGKFVSTYTPRKTEEYEAHVREWMIKEYGHRLPMDGVISARYEFVLERPKSKPDARYSNTKPDIDNLVKSFQDALDFKVKENGLSLGVVANDSRIAHIEAVKRYADDDEEPGTFFTFEII